jgi:hypothetical protein
VTYLRFAVVRESVGRVLRVIISGCIREPVLRLEASGPVAKVVISSCITVSAVC